MKWQSSSLGEVTTRIRNGLNINQTGDAGGLPITRIETISNQIIDPNRVGFAGIPDGEKTDWYLSPGEIVFSHINSEERIGNCALYDGVPHPLIHGMNLLALMPNERKILPKFLLHYIRSAQFRMSLRPMIKRAVNQASVSIGNLKGIEIPLPPLSEQRRIVDILDEADALRKKRIQVNAKAARILPALFYKMFGDPATNPKGLYKKKLSDLIKVRSGNFLPAKDMDPEGQYPVYGGNGINGYHSQFMFEEPVIVIGRVGIYCGAVHYSESRCWVTDNALYVAELSKELHPRYLVEALRMANLNRYAGRAGQPLISGSRIYPVEILIPDPEEQRKFALNVEGLRQVEKCRKDAGEKIEKLFSLLLHRAFSGDLTAKWREAHMKELLVELETQAKSLEVSAAASA